VAFVSFFNELATEKRNYARDLFLIMASERIMIWKDTMSKDCYPRYLGITRRSCLEAHMVLDMEYESRLT
jgi:hypothetical protein